MWDFRDDDYEYLRDVEDELDSREIYKDEEYTVWDFTDEFNEENELETEEVDNDTTDEDYYESGEFFEDIATDLMSMVKATLDHDSELSLDLLNVFNTHFGN